MNQREYGRARTARTLGMNGTGTRLTIGMLLVLDDSALGFQGLVGGGREEMTAPPFPTSVLHSFTVPYSPVHSLRFSSLCGH